MRDTPPWPDDPSPAPSDPWDDPVPRDPRGYPPQPYPPQPSDPQQQGYPSRQAYSPQPNYPPSQPNRPAPNYDMPPGYGPPPPARSSYPARSGYDNGYDIGAIDTARQALPPRQAPRTTAPPRWGTPAPIERPVFAEEPPAPQRAAREAPRHQRHVFGWSLPIEHIVLAAGIVGMFLALTQPWGADAHGNALYLSAITYRAGYYAIGGLAVLGGLLALLNRRMGCLALLGCLGLFALPIVLAATVGGIEVFTQLHVVPHLTTANVQGTNRGFFLWWGGLAVTIAGLFFEVITHRRKGLLGI